MVPPPWSMLFTTWVATIWRPSRCARICAPKRSGSGAREVALELGGEVRVLGHVGVEDRLLQVDLAVREQHRELRAREPAVVALALADLLVVRQRLELAVEVAARLEEAQEALVHVDHARRVRLGEAERLGLLVVVLQHERRDGVGHLDEQLVALLLGEVARLDHGVEQDLDVHLAVRAVHAARVVDRVGVHAARPRARTRSRPRWVTPRLPPSPTTLARSSEPSTRTPSLALSPASAWRLRAAPSRTCRCRRSRAGPPARGGAPGSARWASAPRPRSRAPRAPPARAGSTSPCARTRRRPPRSRRGRSRPRTSRGSSNSRSPLLEAPLRVRVRVDEDVPVVERADEPDVAREQHAVAEHVARHVADADDREVLGLDVASRARGSGASRTPRRRAR